MCSRTLNGSPGCRIKTRTEGAEETLALISQQAASLASNTDLLATITTTTVVTFTLAAPLHVCNGKARSGPND